MAVALARTATTAAHSLLIEMDQMGSGADLLLGAEDEPGLRWPDLTSVRGRLPPGSLLGAVPIVDGLHILSWDRSSTIVGLTAEAARAVLDSAVTEFGVVVLDLPRRLDDAATQAVRAADRALIVVPAEVRATAATRRVITELREHLADVRVVVRLLPEARLRAEAVAAALELPLAGVLRPEPGLRTGLDRGEPPGRRPARAAGIAVPPAPGRRTHPHRPEKEALIMIVELVDRLGADPAPEPAGPAGTADEAELMALVGAAATETGRVLGTADALAVTARVRANSGGSVRCSP